VGLFLARHLEKYIESDLIPEHFPVNQFVEAAALCWGSRFLGRRRMMGDWGVSVGF
jgi:hypothetical protein